MTIIGLKHVHCQVGGQRAGIEVEIGEDRLKVWHSDSTLRTVIWLKKEEI